MIEQAEAAKLLEESPELQKFSSRLRTIEMLKEDATREQDLVLMKDSYETILRMQERLYTEILTYISQEHETIFKDLEAVCYEQRDSISMLADIIGYLINTDDTTAPVKQKDRSHLQLIKK